MTLKEREIRALWQQNFHDDERFVELLFSHLYRDENAIGFEQNGEWITALQMLPYRFTWGKSLLDVAYISGAATRPEYRNQGWMHRLLVHSFETMRDRGIPLSALIPAEPWLYDYYAARGYAPLFFREEHRYASSQLFESKGYHRVASTRGELFAFFEEQMKSRPHCIQHSRDAFEVICGDIELEGGVILSIANEKRELVAVSFSVCRDDEVIVKELLACSPEAETALLHEIEFAFPGKTICRYSPYRGRGEKVLHGMMRIIDVEQLLSLVAENNPSLLITIRVTDAQLPHNNGDYRLANGVCVRESAENPDHDVDVAGLAQLLLGDKLPAPYMGLMLD